MMIEEELGNKISAIMLVSAFVGMVAAPIIHGLGHHTLAFVVGLVTVGPLWLCGVCVIIADARGG